MKKLLSLLSLILIVSLSGCTYFGLEEITGQRPTIDEDGLATGVIIKSFGPDIPEIYSEDSVTFTVTVENVGEEDALNVKAKLFGLGSDWSWTTGKQTIGDGTLLKSVSEEGLPGGIADYQWDVESPLNLKVDNTYTAGVRVYYSYKTTAYGTLKVYNYNYLRANPERSDEVMKSSGIASFDVTKAPVTVSLRGAARPYIYRTSGQTGSITIMIEKIGRGHQYSTSEDDRTVTIDKIKVGDTTCKSSATAKLPTGGEKSVSCTFTLPEVDEFTTIPVEVELSYNYFVDGSAKIKVLKAINGGVSSTGELILPWA